MPNALQSHRSAIQLQARAIIPTVLTISMIDPAACAHTRWQVIAKDNDAEYVECLDCGAILEAAELHSAPAPGAGGKTDEPNQPKTPSKSTESQAPEDRDESLSDA